MTTSMPWTVSRSLQKPSSSTSPVGPDTPALDSEATLDVNDGVGWKRGGGRIQRIYQQATNGYQFYGVFSVDSSITLITERMAMIVSENKKNQFVFQLPSPGDVSVSASRLIAATSAACQESG